MNDLIFVLILVGAGQGLFVFLLLIFTTGRYQNIYLGFLFFSYSLQLIDLSLLFSTNILKYPSLAFLGVPFNLAFGPLIYLYIKNHRADQRWDWNKELPHFIPALLHLGYLTLIYHIKPEAYKVQFLETLIDQLSIVPKFDLPALIFPFFLYLQFGSYTYFSHRLLRESPAPGGIMERWLRNVWRGTLAIGLFGFLQTLMILLEIRQQPVTGYIAAVMVLSYIYYGSMIVFKRSPVLYGKAFTKYHYSKLGSQQLDEILLKLNSYMRHEKPYLDPTLSLNKLSSALGLSERHLSQVINGHLKKNFSEFLNEFRVEEVQHQVLDSKNDSLSLLGIAMQSGFNSKSTFQSAFKKITGMTPSEFKKTHSNK